MEEKAAKMGTGELQKTEHYGKDNSIQQPKEIYPEKQPKEILLKKNDSKNVD